jgi:transcriptional regulator with XRE-family HTH domain
VNESLCRALVAAGLGEADVAARLGVDPKTVRRWLEGRVPHRRYRWALAAMLGLDETVFWPGLDGRRDRPDDAVAVYPRRDDVPAEAWVRLLGSAKRQVGMLGGGGPFLARQCGVRSVLLERVRTGVQVRVCLRDPHAPSSMRDAASADGDADALAFFAPLASHGVQVRVHTSNPYGGMVFADEEMLMVQRAWGVAEDLCPVLHLKQRQGSGLFAGYLQSFERVWAIARPVG